ncbi:M24 family metallopeptidase [Chloroflexota bacterium]
MAYYGKYNNDWQQRIDFQHLRNERIKRAHEMLHKYDIGAAMVFSWDSARYLSNPWSHPYTKHVPFRFVLLIRDAGFPYISTIKNFDDMQVINDCPWLKDRIVTEDILSQPEVIRFRSDEDAAKRWARTVQQIRSLMKEHGVDGLPVSIDYGPPHMTKALQDTGIKVIDGNAWILEAGMVKMDDEIELMKMAATCNEAGYAAVFNEFRPGMRECDAQGIMAKGIYGAGAEYLEGWVVNSGPRTSPRQFNWSDRTVRPGELMSLEACHVNYCGYKVCYDRTFLVAGKPTELQKKLYETTAELHHRVMDLLKPGITTLDIDRSRPFPPKRFKSLKDLSKFHDTWYTNHFGGMGIRWEDAPSCTANEPERVIEKNMCIAYHSIFCVEGYEGVAIENTYRITETGCENLCKWPFDELMIIGT